MIGLLVVQSLRAAGCGTIVGVDPEREKLALARKARCGRRSRRRCGDVAEEIGRLTAGRGADVAFDVVGIEPSLRTAVASLRKGGSLTLVGNLSREVALPLQTVVTRQLTLLGSCASSGEYAACLDMIARKAVNVDALISAVAPAFRGRAVVRAALPQRARIDEGDSPAVNA